MLEDVVRDAGGKVEEAQRLRKILISPTGVKSNDTKVSKVR